LVRINKSKDILRNKYSKRVKKVNRKCMFVKKLKIDLRIVLFVTQFKNEHRLPEQFAGYMLRKKGPYLPLDDGT